MFARTLELGGGRSRLRVGRGAVGALEELWPEGCEAAALIGDTRVLELVGAPLEDRLGGLAKRVVRCPFPPGEAHKTRATKAELEDRLLEAELGRDGCVVAVGGGISLDMGGFVAATYLRGVPWIGVPTSLLAQVDAAVGGKTGVNTPHGKNLVGAFHQPLAVLVDPDFLATLPAEEWRNGLAELVKTAFVGDAELFEWLDARAVGLATHGRDIDHAVERAVAVKAAIVQEDERESGLRAVLNFGHTVGHALETATGHDYRHGEAVAIGMAIEADVAVRLCGLAPEQKRRLVDCLRAFGLPVKPPDVPFAALVPFLARDKKRRAGVTRLTLPERVGHMHRAATGYTLVAPLGELEAAWERARGPA
ncbi:MAG: 3-dehydroquinate synthase [Myxococcales bacterium]|nr:3-dehydroquinate synthase [Myxococcales bacterium]